VVEVTTENFQWRWTNLEILNRCTLAQDDPPHDHGLRVLFLDLRCLGLLECPTAWLVLEGANSEVAMVLSIQLGP